MNVSHYHGLVCDVVAAVVAVGCVYIRYHRDGFEQCCAGNQRHHRRKAINIEEKKSTLPVLLVVLVNVNAITNQIATSYTFRHSPGNACNANRGMHCIHNWTTLFESSSKTLVPCGFDIVSFNFGVHDTSHDQEHLPLDVRSAVPYSAMVLGLHGGPRTQPEKKQQKKNGLLMLVASFAAV